MEDIKSKLEAIKAEMKAYRKIKSSNSEARKFTGVAFVIFNKQSDVTRVLEFYELSITWRVCSYILYKVLRVKNRQVGSTFFGQNRLIATRAAEPTDVFWENLNAKTHVRVKKSFYAYAATLFVLGIIFGINMAVSYAKDDFEEDSRDKSGNTDETTLLGARLLAVSMTLLVVIANFVLGRFVRRFSSFQRHKTYSEYHISVAIKLSLAMFINTAIVPLLINYKPEHWFTASGLVQDVTLNLLGVCFISPLTYIFDPRYLLKLCRRYRSKRAGTDCKLTQKELNRLYEGPMLDMAQRYSNLMLLFMLTMFYTPLIPVTPLITGLGALLQY